MARHKSARWQWLLLLCCCFAAGVSVARSADQVNQIACGLITTFPASARPPAIPCLADSLPAPSPATEDQRKQYIQGVLGRSNVAGKRLDHAGSGFFVSVDGGLITTTSVVDGCSLVSVSPMYGEIALAQVVKADPRSGIALLRANITAPGVATLTGSEGAFFRHPIYVFGYPQLGSVTSEPTLTPVRALNSQATVADVPAILIEGDIRSGFNGGPVLDSGGGVIGVMAPGKTQVSGATDGVVESTGMAIPSETLVSFLEAAGLNFHTGLQLPPKPADRLLIDARPLVAQIGCWQ